MCSSMTVLYAENGDRYTGSEGKVQNSGQCGQGKKRSRIKLEKCKINCATLWTTA
jgi:hypothetical protein